MYIYLYVAIDSDAPLFDQPARPLDDNPISIHIYVNVYVYIYIIYIHIYTYIYISIHPCR